MIPINISHIGAKLKLNVQRATMLNIGIHITIFLRKMFKVRNKLTLAHDKSQKVIIEKAMAPVPEKRTKVIRASPIKPPQIREIALVIKTIILKNNP